MIILHRHYTDHIILADNRQIAVVVPQLPLRARAASYLHELVLLQRCCPGRRCDIRRHSGYILPLMVLLDRLVAKVRSSGDVKAPV